MSWKENKIFKPVGNRKGLWNQKGCKVLFLFDNNRKIKLIIENINWINRITADIMRTYTALIKNLYFRNGWFYSHQISFLYVPAGASG
ncbi:hypothetical protein, partial [Dialister sp.]|uniref:hypothetical protein n=1 Tax=Dialister sp. TaxID=1955814 RepID=UPI003F11504B